jgi:hypothetical protein
MWSYVQFPSTENVTGFFSPERMAATNKQIRSLSFRATRIAAVVACLFFLPAVGLSPGPYSSLGMPWPVFFVTWGVMLLAALISLIGYFACRSRGERVSVFYSICPASLLAAFLVLLNLYGIDSALSS